MKRICGFCHLPFSEDAMIGIERVTFDALEHPDTEFFAYHGDEKDIIPVCEPCYSEKSGIKKEFANLPPSLLKHQYPSIKVIEKEKYRSMPLVNQSESMIRVIFTCSINDWRQMRKEFC
jgi:hypothetical protein